MELQSGANAPLGRNQFTIEHNAPSNVDITVFVLQANGKVRGDDDMVFYGQPNGPSGCVKLHKGQVEVNLSSVPSGIERLAITGTLDSGTFADLHEFKLTADGKIMSFTPKGRTEAALILAEIYLRKGEWKIRCVGQGFNGGLAPLAESYGVDVETPVNNTPTNEPPKQSQSINLSKIDLTKSKPSINLEKRAGSIGEIRANLNWSKKKSGFFSSPLDLDLGAYIEFVDGDRDLIQALGERFVSGNYIRLLDDDRSGASSDGEWIHVNGDKLNDVSRIMFFAYIYEGAASWNKADGVFTLHVPGMPPIETRLTEGSSGKGFCCVAELIVNNGQVTARRIDEYFEGHLQCDERFGWGFEWKRGRK
ncbi:MAG: stress protein, tellurium resistance protein TerD [Oceanospirillaceae bacterium]|nr:stress protein, tellurium resistance protein TerD [Oceanospirillaceae bacterium]